MRNEPVGRVVCGVGDVFGGVVSETEGVMDWQPAIERIELSVVGVSDDSPLCADRVQQWRNFEGPLPPVLVTETGWIVDGRHRHSAAGVDDRLLWGHIVRRVGEHWVATGNVVRVL